MKIVFTFFLILLACVAVLFASLNANAVTFNYFFGKTSISLSILLIVALAAGVLLSWLVYLPWWLLSKHRQRRVHAKLAQAEKELDNLRQIPIKDSH